MAQALIAAAQSHDLAAIREMMHEYAEWLKVDLSFQGFAREVDGLPGDYAPPDGALLVARLDHAPVGMVALRRADEQRCEMKRLYVRPSARGHGLGGQLVEHIIREARSRGYREMRLDTLPIMGSAQQLYLTFGFRDIAPYYPSPVPGTRYMALVL